MERSLKKMGLKCAGIRTLVLGIVIWFFLDFAREFGDGGLNSIMLDILIMFILLMIIVVTWIYALLGGPFRYIKRFCNQSDNPKETMQKLERAWDNKFATPNCLVSDEYFVWARKLRAVVIPLEKIHGISLEEGGVIIPNYLRIYLKDNTLQVLALRGTQGRKIIEYIEQNIEGITTGERAHLGLQRTLVGKINIRYQIVRVRERLFIIDYANPSKLSSYLSAGPDFRFGPHKAKGAWRAWEISQEELRNIKYKPLEASRASSGSTRSLIIGIPILLGALTANSPIMDILPIQSLIGTQIWVLVMILAAIVLICLFFANILSRFETKKYTEVRISRKVQYTKNQLVWYIVARTIILSVILYFVVMFFVWNAGLLLYPLAVLVLMGYIFAGFMGEGATIDPKSTVSVLYKKVKSKEKRRVVKLKSQKIGAI